MRTPPTGSIRLEERQVFDIHNGVGLSVRCVSGAVWITQDGDRDDRIIKPGQTFVLDRKGLTLVSAPIGPATVRVEPAARRAPFLQSVVRQVRALRRAA